jgi:hypothetical protein
LLSKNTKIKIYRTIILPLVLYGCEAWEHRLRVFENRVLGKIFGPKRDRVTGEWRRLHNKELNDLYSSPNIIWSDQIKNEVGGACSMYGGEGHTGFWWGALSEGDHLEHPGIDGRIILKGIFKWDGGHGLD